MVAAAASNNIHEVNVIIFLIFLSISGYFIHQTDARKCYVCGPNANIPLKMSNDKLLPSSSSSSIINKESPSIIESCDNFQTTNDNQNVNVNQKFIMDCPLNFQGCLTFINGTMITRTCEEADVNDCQMVNNIKYCICDYDLCNLNDTDYDYNNYNDNQQKLNQQRQQKQSVNKQQKQKDTISVTDIKSYHLSYNKMKPSVLLTNSNNNNNNNNNNSDKNSNDNTGHHQQHSNYTFTTTPALNNNNSSMTTSQMGSSNVQSLATQKNNYNLGSNFASINNNSNSLPSYPRMNGTNQLPINYNNMDINKSSKENGNQKIKFCWMYLILVAAVVFE